MDILNHWLVSADEDGHIVIQNPPFHLTRDAALVLAAWLVALAEPKATYGFDTVLEAVRNA